LVSSAKDRPTKNNIIAIQIPLIKCFTFMVNYSFLKLEWSM
jgi:hypothetical protein